MTFTVNWATRVVSSDASIPDVIAAHTALRILEASEAGVLYPPIITYKELALGGATVFPQIDFINGYTLTFPNAGSYTITGNFNCTINPTAGVYVERKTSLAFAVSTTGGGISADTVAAAVWQRAIEAGFTAEQILRILAAQAAGAATGLEGPTPRFKGLDGATTRIAGTYDAGNRAITGLNGS